MRGAEECGRKSQQSETTLAKPHQLSFSEAKKGAISGGTPSEVTEVTKLYNERMMTLKSPTLQCPNGVIA